MRIEVDTSRCQLNGECALAAPDLFAIGDDDVLRWNAEPPAEQHEQAAAAVAACPVQAIRAR